MRKWKGGEGEEKESKNGREGRKKMIVHNHFAVGDTSLVLYKCSMYDNLSSLCTRSIYVAIIENVHSEHSFIDMRFIEPGRDPT